MNSLEEIQNLYLLERPLDYINSKFIKLTSYEIKRNNIILKMVSSTIINSMREMDDLFNCMYKEIFYGGSYYDKLKVGKPNEYDLDLVQQLPDICQPEVQCSEHPGFVQVQIHGYHNILVLPSSPENSPLLKITNLMENCNYLSTNKYLKWIESLVNRALNKFNKDINNERYIDVPIDTKEALKMMTRLAKSGPAFTLKLTGKDFDGSDIQLDIDLVPCFRFGENDWPNISGGYRPNPKEKLIYKEHFFVVPKKPREAKLANNPNMERFWRLSFQEQERELMGKNKRALKPALKLIKKMRDRYEHTIASYFIKTVFLWTVEIKPDEFWNQPLCNVFFEMLKIYSKYLQTYNIPYYWNPGYNLIGYLKQSTKVHICKTIQNIIRDISNSLMDQTDPYMVGRFLLSKEEYEELKVTLPLTKKQEKLIAKSRNINMSSTSLHQLSNGDNSCLMNRSRCDSTMVQVVKTFTERNYSKNIN
ncbi:hypothetical protein ABEB36_001524 [Hypothenemus hampei]|uniref:Cyclic GMP-AMP synthase n=1 Tax=Hypothenemus hampei TaxID=57062 RepID=A0ABD1FET7_HYPHA